MFRSCSFRVSRRMKFWVTSPSDLFPVRMAVKEEDFYYHAVSQDIVEDMIFAMEGWIPYVDLVQVFDNELGLCISKDYMVTAGRL